jgi:hypothetical protein
MTREMKVMRTIPGYAYVAALLIFTAGCGKGGAPSTSAQSSEPAKSGARPTGAGHGAVDAVPGSYEDWCEEHQVPESQDTRCDPSLIPAFQASNDWCADHGLPMSQCRIHNPNLEIVRPPKPEGK